MVAVPIWHRTHCSEAVETVDQPGHSGLKKSCWCHIHACMTLHWLATSCVTVTNTSLKQFKGDRLALAHSFREISVCHSGEDDRDVPLMTLGVWGAPNKEEIQAEWREGITYKVLIPVINFHHQNPTSQILSSLQKSSTVWGPSISNMRLWENF